MSYVAYPPDSKAPPAVTSKTTLAHAVADYAKPTPKPVVEVHPVVAAALAAHAEASKAEAVAVHPEAKAAATEAKVQAAAAADAHAAGQPEKAAVHAEAAVAAAHTAMIKAVHPAVRAAASMAKSHAEAAVAHATGQALTAHEKSQPNATAKMPEHENEVRMYSTISTWMAAGAVALAAIVVVLRGSPAGIASQPTFQSLKLLGLVLTLIVAFLASGMGLSIAAIPYSSEARSCFSVNAHERAIASSVAYGVGAGVAAIGVVAVVLMVNSDSPGKVDETKLNAGMLGVVVAALIGGAGSLMTMSSAKASTKLEASSSFASMSPDSLHGSSGWWSRNALKENKHSNRLARNLVHKSAAEKCTTICKPIDRGGGFIGKYCIKTCADPVGKTSRTYPAFIEQDPREPTYRSS